MNWRQEQEALENAYARRLLIEYGIREVTTQRQAKNGTREFEFPVSKHDNTNEYYKKWLKSKGISLKDTPRLRLACFKTGYVRNQNSCASPYQLNKQYKREYRRTLMDGTGKLFTHKTTCIDREKIWGMMAMMHYMLEYYKRNWLK